MLANVITVLAASGPGLVTSGRMFATAAMLLALVNQVSGTPYVSGGDSPGGMDCSGLVSWVTNAATGRPVYGDRFHTGNIEGELLERGFRTAPRLVRWWVGTVASRGDTAWRHSRRDDGRPCTSAAAPIASAA